MERAADLCGSFLLESALTHYCDLGFVSSLFMPAPFDELPEPVVVALELVCLAACFFLWLAMCFFDFLVTLGVVSSF